MIGLLERLTELDLSKNQIRSLPESIGDCVSLRRLNLSENELETLYVNFVFKKNEIVVH